jgi:replicative DNA helicase
MASKKLSEDEFIKKCKTPIVSWKEFQKRLPTKEEVNAWFDKWPNASIGIVTGAVSGIVVFDLDSEHAVEYAENDGGFPDTPKVKTGKGWHIFVQHPGFEVRNDVRKELDIDIRADGGYVVAPPSYHGNGHQYTWEEGSSIFEIDPAPCEPWMVDYLKEVATSCRKPTKEKLPNPSEVVYTASKSVNNNIYAGIAKNGAKQGQRNATTAKYIGHLFGKGNDEAVVWEMIQLWNTAKNNPPLDQDELKKIFESIRNSERKKETKEKKNEEIDVKSFLDTDAIVNTEYDEHYVRVPFAAGDLLSIMQSKLNGGLIGGRTYVLGGIPSASKTMLVNNMGDNVCMNGHPVLFFSYDDGRLELRCRTYCRFSGFDIEDFNSHRVSKSDIKGICRNDSVSVINRYKYVVEGNIKIDEWPKLIEQIIARHQKAPVMIIDYLRKIKSASNRLDERLRVDEIMTALTDMAKTYNLPVMLISELSRESYKTGQRLSMTSYKESGSIEYEASWLGILAAVEDDGRTLKNDWERIIDYDGNVDLIVFKAKRARPVSGSSSERL